MPLRIPRVLVLNTTESAFGSRLSHGIVSFVHQHAPWFIYTTDQGRHLPEIVERFRPDGMIVTRVPSAEPADWICRQNIPCIFVAVPSAVHETHPLLLNDHAAIGSLGAGHLLETRAMRYAFVGYEQTPFSQEREDAFREIFLQNRMPVDSYHVGRFEPGGNVLDPYAADSCSGPFANWLSALPRPFAIMAANDELAHNTALICLQLGIKIPKEAAILGVDDDARYCQSIYPALSSISTPAGGIGWKAAALLTDWMTGRRPAPGIQRQAAVQIIQRQSTSVNRVQDAAVEQALAFIHEHLANRISIPSVARRAGVSRRSLEIRFMKELGRSPLMEVRRLRIERAKRMLIDTSDPIYTIAGRVGFASSVRFCIVFREMTGMRPLEYRKTLRTMEGEMP